MNISSFSSRSLTVSGPGPRAGAGGWAPISVTVAAGLSSWPGVGVKMGEHRDAGRRRRLLSLAAGPSLRLCNHPWHWQSMFFIVRRAESSDFKFRGRNRGRQTSSANHTFDGASDRSEGTLVGTVHGVGSVRSRV
jgi:hypothetical protein